MKNSIILLIVFFSLPALARRFFTGPDTHATETALSAEIFATMTAMLPTATFTMPSTDTPPPTSTPTITPTDTPVPSPTITNTPEPTFTPDPTKPTQPTFGPVYFYTDEDYNQENFENPTTEFRSGTMQVCAINDFAGMKGGLVTTEIVYRSGIIWYHQVGNWEDNKEEGITSLCLWDQDGTALDTGDCLYEFYVGDELASGGMFKVVP